MKKRILTLTTGLILVMGLIFSSGCGNSAKEADTKAHEPEMEEAVHDHGDEMAEDFYCPMKCEGDITYTESGSCPVCKMDLVADEGE